MKNYKKIDDVWYVEDKNGKYRKVTSKQKLQELNNSIDTTKDDGELPVQGVGDVIEKVTNFLKINKCKPCEERRKELNRLLPFANLEDIELTEEEEENLAKAKESPIVPAETAKAIFAMYNKYFAKKRPVKFCQCGGTFKRLLERLTLISNRE
jgi:hypothetical protein